MTTKDLFMETFIEHVDTWTGTKQDKLDIYEELLIKIFHHNKDEKIIELFENVVDRIDEEYYVSRKKQKMRV
jgi:hypothetical protein